MEYETGKIYIGVPKAYLIAEGLIEAELRAVYMEGDAVKVEPHIVHTLVED